MAHSFSICLDLSSPDATAGLAAALAQHVHGGDTLLLEGEIGAGKSHFARALIRRLLGENGNSAEIPSPTYTLVQTYETDKGEVWHADLYRISDESEVLELGLDEAMASAIVLIEWPDLLGSLRPDDALTVSLAPGASPESRMVTLSGPERFKAGVEKAASKVA